MTKLLQPSTKLQSKCHSRRIHKLSKVVPWSISLHSMHSGLFQGLLHHGSSPKMQRFHYLHAQTSGRQALPVNRTYSLLPLIFETVVVSVCLSLSLASLPERLRSSLWAAGAKEGWNSDPHERVYFYANYKDPPPVPFIWTQGCSRPSNRQDASIC